MKHARSALTQLHACGYGNAGKARPLNNAENAENAGAIFRLVAEKHGLTPSETLLMAVCECALRLDIDNIAVMCRQARITDEQIHLHGKEIGVDKALRPAMVHNIRKFVQFFSTMSNLNIVEFEGAIQGRTLLAYQGINIIDKQKWLAVIHFACDSLEYFGSKSTVYERLMDFGFGPVKYSCRAPQTHPNVSAPKSSTEKKKSLVMYTQNWTFAKKKLHHNVQRYTNGHTKPKESPLAILAKVALG